MQTLKEKLGTFWLGTLLLAIIGAIAYLPHVTKLGYMNDDWYLMFDGYVGGASFFHHVFSIDRPLRGYVMQVAFSLFGMNSLYYHLSAFVFRVISAISLFWLGNQLWASRKTYNWLAALIFLIYPGFLSQVNPIDYQSQIFSLACGMFSIVCTVRALQSQSSTSRWMYTIVSILLTWMYLGLVEYFLGFEALRLTVIMILALRKEGQSISTKWISAFRTFFPFSIGAIGFLVWRLFLFETERRATDVSVQLSAVLDSPLILLWWLNYLIQDVFTVILSAWSVSLNIFAFSLRLRDSYLGFLLALLTIIIVLNFLRRAKDDVLKEAPQQLELMQEQIWLAIVTIVACLIPVILVNRHVTLPDYSRYALAPSVGVAVLLSVLIEKNNIASLRAGMIGFLLATSVMTHHGNAIRVLNETEATQNFWWQVSWRAPMIKEDVTLIASYPNGSLAEDYFIWGPANLIYYPEKQTTIPVQIKLPSAVLTSDVINKITSEGGIETPLRRGNYFERNFDNVLVMIQSSPNGCVRFINGNAPELSAYDEDRLVLISPYSKLENVITESEMPVVPTAVFGNEPEHTWCYYYQQADLARQRGEWEIIPQLLNEALEKGYYPEDGLEWMPFLQAYAINGNVEKMRSTLKLIAIDRTLSLQTCDLMLKFKESQNLSDEVQEFIEKKVCE